MKISFKNTVVLTSAVTMLSLAACTPGELTEGGQSSAGGTTITYALWDPNQKLVYEKCATQFKREFGSRSNSPDGTTTGRTYPSHSMAGQRPTYSPTTSHTIRNSPARGS